MQGQINVLYILCFTKERWGTWNHAVKGEERVVSVYYSVDTAISTESEKTMVHTMQNFVIGRLAKAPYMVAAHVLSGLAVGALLLSAMPAQAQSTAPAQAATEKQKATEAPAIPVPDAVLAAGIAGDENSAAAVKAWLAAGATPAVRVARGVALIKSLRRSPAAKDPAAILAAADRIATMVADDLSGRRVTQLAVDKDFRPSAKSIAWDLGPQDGTTHPGFERVLPGDSRIEGGNMQALRRPSDDPLLTDGIVGIERLKVKVAEGRYRIVLMTEPIGEASTQLSPFGRTVVINGVEIPVADAPAAEWGNRAYLSQDSAALAASYNGNPAPGGGPVIATQAGGVIIVEGSTRGTGNNAELIIELRQPAGRRSYITGLLVEPAEEPSSLWRTPEDRSADISLDEQFSLEGSLLDSIAELVEDLAPAAGPQATAQVRDLPEVIFESPEVVSPS